MLLSFFLLGVALVVLYAVWRFNGYGSEIFLRRRLEIFDDFPALTFFEESSFFGFFKLKIWFPPKRLPRAVSKVESVNAEVGGKLPPAEESRVRPAEKSNELSEQLVQVIPRWPKSMFRMPRYVQLEVLGKEARYELVPVIVQASGFFRFAMVEDEEVSSASTEGDSKKSNKPRVRHPLHFWGYISQGETIGFVSGRRYAMERYSDHCLSPKSGHIVGFQVLNGTQVEKGDIVMIIAAKIG